jgi:hypothetical protein
MKKREFLPELLPDLMNVVESMNNTLQTIEGGESTRARLDRLLRRLRTGEAVTLHGHDRRLLVVAGSFFQCGLTADLEGYRLALVEKE